MPEADVTGWIQAANLDLLKNRTEEVGEAYGSFIP
jgi:hypothetical protein